LRSLKTIKKNNSDTMEAQKNTKKYWIYCFAWVAIMVTLMFVYREFFWLALPGAATYFAKAMDIF
jgi:hypothetical protein